MRRVMKLLLLTPLALLAACGGHAPVRPAAASAAPAAAPVATSTPPRTDVLLARARALRAEGDVPAARARLEAAHQVDPAAPAVRVELADVLVAEGMELGRAAALLFGLADTPDGRVSLVRARLCEARGDDAGAAAAYGLALAASDDPEARLRRALALERLGRTDEQIVELERIRIVRPGDTFARAHLGDAYEEAGRRPEAEAELRWVAESQPERPAGWLRLARFYERAGRTREAQEAAQKARVASGTRQERNLRPLLRSKN